MIRITFRHAQTGEETVIEAEPGQSLMAAATGQGVAGIDAICGGSMACGTCHVYVAEDWFDRLPPPTAEEQEIADCGVAPRATSRLACQIRLEPALDGLVVTTPVSQL